MTEIIKLEFYVPLRETCYRNGLLKSRKRYEEVKSPKASCHKGGVEKI